MPCPNSHTPVYTLRYYQVDHESILKREPKLLSAAALCDPKQFYQCLRSTYLLNEFLHEHLQNEKHIIQIHYKQITLPITFIFGKINILTTSVPSSERPWSAPYREERGTLSPCCRALLNILVTLVWMLFVLVLKFLHICAISLEAKSRRAQWLSWSGRLQNCFDTIQVVTEGINSCNWKQIK